MVPNIEFVSSKDPESRVANDGTVTVTCSPGYKYGGSSVANIVCNKDTTNNNFPASCRSEYINSHHKEVEN
jgi:hypothetical protein